MDSPALRKAVEVTNPLRTTFELRLGQSRAIYIALNALNNTAALRSKLNGAQLRLLSMTLRDYRNNGVGLPPAKRARFNAIINKLQQLSTNYTNNILDSTKVGKGRSSSSSCCFCDVNNAQHDSLVHPCYQLQQQLLTLSHLCRAVLAL